MFWIVFLLIYYLPAIFSLATKCDKMDVTTSWLDYNGTYLGSLTVGMEIINFANSDTSVNVSSYLIDLPEGSPFSNFTFLCQELPDESCIHFANNSFLTFPATNMTIWFSTGFSYFGKLGDDYIFNVIVDEGSFSMNNKSIFSPNQDTYVVSDVSVQVSRAGVPRRITFQCKSFTPVPEPQIAAPRCNNFRSRTSILDAQNNYKVLSTGKVTYEMYKNETDVFVEFIDHGINEFFLNNYDSANSFPLCSPEFDVSNCTFSFTYDDSKFLFGFYMIGGYQTPQGFDGIQTPSFIIGRIINRNGQTLMEEGRPYTPQDSCLYFSRPLTSYPITDPLKGSYAITSEFCCTTFEQIS